MNEEIAQTLLTEVAKKTMDDVKERILDFFKVDTNMVPWGVIASLASTAADSQDYLADFNKE